MRQLSGLHAYPRAPLQFAMTQLSPLLFYLFKIILFTFPDLLFERAHPNGRVAIQNDAVRLFQV